MNRISHIFRWLVIVIGLSAGSVAHPEDIGLYRIQGGFSTTKPDQDGAQRLKEKAEQKYATGEAQKAIKSLQEQNVNALLNPKALPVPTNKAKITKFYSMDFVMPEDSEYAKKGARINVLRSTGRISDTASALVFIDGRDQEQVDYAVALFQKMPVKIVLTGGSPIEIGGRYKSFNAGNGIPFGFDQRGLIIGSLRNWYSISLESVPALLTNGGNGNLRIDYGI